MSKDSSIKDFARIDQSSDPPILYANYPRTYRSDIQENRVEETDCL